MVHDALRHALVQPGGHDRECASLAAALHHDVLSVPFREGSQQVQGPHQAQVHALHVVAVAIFDAVRHITVIPAVESGRNLIELLRAHPRIQPVNLHLQADEAVLCVILMPQRLFDGLDTGTGRAQHHRMLPLLRILGIEEIAVNGLGGVQHQLDQVTFHLVGAIFLGQFLRISQWELLRFGDIVLPELLEISRFLREGPDAVHPEAQLDVVAVGHPVHLDLQAQVAEARVAAGAHVNPGAAALQGHGAVGVGLQHVTCDVILHDPVARNAVFVELHLHGGLLAGLVEPVVMVGHRDP